MTELSKVLFDARKEKGLSREKACFEMDDKINHDRLEKIENGKVQYIAPEEVVWMADAYDKPEICNFYCMNECEIGRRYGRNIAVKDLAHIAIDTLNSLNRIDSSKNRLLEIVADETISPDEMDDFMKIKETLDQIATTADSLKYWMAKAKIEK